MIPDTDDLEISSGYRSDQDPNMQTGLFLQQFTNSVSRALYKERCAFQYGQYLQSDKSTERLNPYNILQGPPVSQSGNCFLPSIHTLNNIQQQLAADQIARKGCNKTSRLWQDDSTSTQKIYTKHHKWEFQNSTSTSNVALASQISFNGNLNSSSRHKLKIPRGFLQKSIKQGLFTNLELPKIMNILDVKGNTWEIHEDTGREENPLPKHSTVLPDVNINHTDLMHRAKVEPSGSKTISFNQVNMSGQKSNDEDVIFVETDRTCVPNTTNTISDDSLEPSCGVPPTNTTRVHCLRDSDLHYHDEFERNKILQRLNSEARMRKITYNEYIQQLSQVHYCSCQREKVINPENTLHFEPDVDWPREENRAIYTRQGVPLFPPELEELYTRSNLTVSTMDINGVGNKRGDFQQQQEDESMGTEVYSFSPYSKRSKSRLRCMYRCSIHVNYKPNDSRFCLEGRRVDREKICSQRPSPNHRYSSRHPNEIVSEVDVTKRSLKPLGERDSSNLQSSKPTLQYSDGRGKESCKLKRNRYLNVDRERFPKIGCVSKEPFVKIQAMNPVFARTDETIKNHEYLAHQQKTEHAEVDSQQTHCSTMTPFILEGGSGIGFGAQRSKIAALGCSCNGHHHNHARLAVTNVVFTRPVAMM